MSSIGEVSNTTNASKIGNTSYQGQGSSVSSVKTTSENADTLEITSSKNVNVSDSNTVSNINNSNKNSEEESTQTTPSLKEAVKKINANLDSCEAVFGIHEGTNRVMIKMVDKETKKTIKEFPAEKTLDLIAKAWELAGIMVDEKR